jgi:hypothetical protein
MPVNIQCPRCNKELSAPEELIGKVAACPRCNTQFPVTVNVRSSAPSMLAAPATSIPSNMPPSTGSSPPSAASDIRRSHSVFSPPAPVTKPAPKGPREAQPARFIAAESGDTRINLGADGRLPELVLNEGSKQEASETAERTSHPIRLIVILCASFVALLWVLTMDAGSGRDESRMKAELRRELQELYARRSQPHHPQKEYQELLSKALQAHNQGKYADEERYYRLVLNLLRAESLQKNAANVKGLTGVRKDNVPSDEHLESLLSRLLSNH